jgi:hypothetical protein
VAGKRFKDTPEYLEERARWDACPSRIEHHTNSRFGIGVLSYFMLADEVAVWTRRFKSEGRLSDALAVRISSASGLFRLEDGPAEVMPEGGTRVRLYLNKTSWTFSDSKYPPPALPISCWQTLERLLWVAEFATSVEEKGYEPLHWQPGIPSPGGKAPPDSRFLPTESPDIWWRECDDQLEHPDHRIHHPATPLLVDGIATESYINDALVNYCSVPAIMSRQICTRHDATVYGSRPERCADAMVLEDIRRAGNVVDYIIQHPKP